MAKWSEDTTIKFVSEYVVHEYLWNVKNNLYKNKQARHSAYTAKKEAMGIPGLDVKAVITKIKNIRSTYSQEVKKINDSIILNRSKVQEEEEDFANYYRMKEACYDNLLQMVKPYLSRQDTCMRKAITAEERLAVTLRYLATERNIKDLKFSVIMSPTAISQSIIKTCEVLIYDLQSYIKKPSKEAWIGIAAEFGDRYQFWNCLGALDGKHVKIQKPEHSGSLYFNYKSYFSIILMALANAKKEFIMIDVGANGRVSDGCVLFYTKFWDLYCKGELNLPEPSPLPYTNQSFPFVEAFALGKNLLKPYQQSACNKLKIFNY